MATAEAESAPATNNGSTVPPESYNSDDQLAAAAASTVPTEMEYDQLAENVEPESTSAGAAATGRWPGWPGDCVFRLIVPVMKVGSIIGRKGDIIKKMCEDTRARIRVLDAPVGTTDRVVLISGKEEPDVPLSPAMDATIRIFKRISGLPVGDDDSTYGAAGIAFCSIRLLVASTQAINLIGKQGSLIKSIQESTRASVRVLSEDESPFYVAADERIVELQGEALKVLKALEAIVGHLRKFLIDHSVLPLFEKNYNALISQERQVEPLADKLLYANSSRDQIDTDYPLSAKREALFLERETQLDSHIPPSRLLLHGQDHTLSSVRSSLLSRPSGPIVTQITQRMQVPISYAEEIIGIQGNNIAYIRHASGAAITVQETSGLPDEITVEIKGTASQVQTAQQLIEDFLSDHKESVGSKYGKYERSLRSVYSQLDNPSYSSTSLSGQPYGRYGSSSVGGYSSYRL